LKTRGILLVMSPDDLDAELVQHQLERVLHSPGFVRNERLSRFLRFVVERHLEGRNYELKESVIGAEVFGRKPDYNPKSDPIVRTEARRLRARLSDYYDGAGASDSIRVELPKGGYVPVIQRTGGMDRRPRPRPLIWILAALAFAMVVVLVLVAWSRSRPGGDPLRRKTTAATYDLYLRAKSLEMHPLATSVYDSISLFEKTVVSDPSFAPAYAGIAAGYATRSAFDRFDGAERAEMIGKGWAAAEKAIRLAPQSADAHDALGMMQARAAQWKEAERSFRRAIELAPRDPLWRNHFALFMLLPLGRFEDAIRQLRTAEELDPNLPQTNSGLNHALTAAGKFEEAERRCYRGAQNDQQSSACWTQTLLRQGNAEQAVASLEKIWSDRLLEPGAQILGIAYAKAGRRKAAERIAAIVPRAASKAAIFAALRDKDRTFEILDQMAPMGPTRIGRDFLILPDFAFLQGDPRWQALRRKVRLP
jgi:Flp pilus assembly protein TadD